MRKYILLILCFFLGSGLAFSQSKRGIALVIGNSAYAEGPLKNPVNDAKDISAKFRSLGFDVISVIDANQEDMGNSIDDFGAKASKYDVAIFYYSGHGIQYNGENYLIPVNARLRSEVDIRYSCENLNRVLAKLEESNCKLKILMLDACRNNPFERSWTRAGSSRGLSSMDAPMGTIISYATAPGSTAEDGVGQRNSPYTAAFLNLLDRQNYSILLLYNDLCNVVRKNTNNRQNPWSSNSGIDGEFSFNVGYVAKPAITSVSNESAEELYKKGNEYYNKSDFAEAVKYYRQAAEKGHASAQLDLGYCYDTGKGVQQNYAEASKWYRKSAEQGHRIAQSNLSYNYANGLGVTKDYAEAVKWAKKSADQGYHAAENRLGNYYYNGQGVAKDYVEAVKWYRKSADKGNEYSMYNLANCYYYGNGVSKDLSQAKYWYQKAADKGHAAAKKKCEELVEQDDASLLYKKGNEYYNKSDFAEAVKYYRQAAEKGHASAQLDLGYCYDTGKGVQQNYAEASKWYRKSAEQGHRIAQSNLSYNYANGLGVTKDYAEAVKWAKKSADQGYHAAENRLGNYYYNGQGVAKDYVEAVKWYRKSADKGNEYAMYNLANCYYYGNGVSKDLSIAKQWYQKSADKGHSGAKTKLTELTEQQDSPEALYQKGKEYYNNSNYSEAVKYYRQAADKGNAQAQFDLGSCYERGRGVSRDLAEAFKWYKKSAEQGNKFAQYSLSLCYENGNGVTMNYSEAAKWVRKSAEQGYHFAEKQLGYYYYYGIGVTKNYTEAFKWYSKAAKHGNLEAYYSLGTCYQDGKGVSKDLSQAKYWYQEAADKGHSGAKTKLKELGATSNPGLIVIEGKVVDEKSIPLMAVAIRVDGTTNGAITDIDGEFSISVAPDAVLTLSCIGMKTQKVSVNNRKTINVVMKAEK